MKRYLMSMLLVGVLLVLFLLVGPNAVLLTSANTFESKALFAEPYSLICDTNYVLRDADPNESTEVVSVYWQGIELMRQGRWDEARSWFADSVLRYPNSRHLHAGLAEVLWYLSIDGLEGPAVLDDAARETLRAVEIGLEFNKVRHTWLLAQTLGRTGDVRTLEEIFEKVLRIAPTFETYLDYALGLSLLDAPVAEVFYQRAIELQPEGNAEALVSYAEWLLDHNREHEVLVLLSSDTQSEYLYFLRGVAQERLGDLEWARDEYSHILVFSQDFPMPGRYRVPGSFTQIGIRFEGDALLMATESQSRVGLSTLIWGEARGESVGGQRAMGWVVRNRVLRGSVGGCPYVNNTGATLAEKYKSVMCQSGQFEGMCSAWCSNPATTACPRNTTTDRSAYDVWYGYAPDPVPPGGYCPGGYNHSKCPDGVCLPCTGVCWGSTYGYSNQGGLFNLGLSGACPTHFCAPTSRGKICGNGGADNCFYTNP